MIDNETQEAIDALAAQLTKPLEQAVLETLSSSFKSINESLEERRAEIETAGDAVKSQLDEFSRDIKTKAGAALTEGIEGRVVPRIEAEADKILTPL